jgi:hypothetical protein
MKKRSQKKGGFLRVLLWSSALLILLAVGTAVYAWSWVQSYMRSPAFTQLIAKQLGRAAKAEAEIEPLAWSGSNVYGPRVSLKPAFSAGWRSIEAEGVQAALDFDAVRHGVWHVSKVDVDHLRLNTGRVNETGASPTVASESAPPAAAPGWLRSWLPSKTEIGDVIVQTLDVTPDRSEAGVSLTNVRVTAHSGADEGAWLLRGEGGKLNAPGLSEPFRITSISSRVDAKALSVNDCIARWKGDCDVTAQGELPFEKEKGWKFSGHLANLDLRHLLSTEWSPKLSGVLEGDYRISAQPGSDVLFNSKLSVKSGIVQALPVLDRIADFTRTDRFRRVVLDQATGDVEREGETTKVTNLVLQSNGLLRIEGSLTIQKAQVAGSFLVGVSPETLRWVPGAQGHVFTQSRADGPPGFVWTTVVISGTLDSVREDLSNRLLAAAGKAIIEGPLDAAGKGVELLGSGGKTAVQGGKTIIEGSKNAVKGAADVLEKGVETGAGLLRGLLPR